MHLIALLGFKFCCTFLHFFFLLFFFYFCGAFLFCRDSHRFPVELGDLRVTSHISLWFPLRAHAQHRATSYFWVPNLCFMCREPGRTSAAILRVLLFLQPCKARVYNSNLGSINAWHRRWFPVDISFISMSATV